MGLTTDPVISPRHGRRFVFRRTRVGGGRAGAPTSRSPAATAPTAIPVGGVGRTAAGWGRRYAFRLLLVDLLGLLVAALVVHLTRFPPGGADGAIDRNLAPFVALTATLVIVWMLALAWSGSRDPTTIGYGAIEYHRVIRATFTVFGVAAIASYLLKVELPRSYLLVMMPVGLAVLLGARFGCRRWLHRQRDTGRYLSRVLALGTVDTVTELLHDLRRAPRAGYTVIGVCLGEHHPSADTADNRPRNIDGVPVLGDLNTVAEHWDAVDVPRPVVGGVGGGVMLAQAHADHGVPGPRGAAQVVEQLGHRVDGAQRQHAGQIPAGVTLAVQPPPAAEPGPEQHGEPDRHHHQQVAAGQLDLEQIGRDRGHPENRERGPDDAVILDRAVADGGRIPAAGPGQGEHPDDHQGRRQRHERRQIPVDGTVRAARREPGEMHDQRCHQQAQQIDQQEPERIPPTPPGRRPPH